MSNVWRITHSCDTRKNTLLKLESVSSNESYDSKMTLKAFQSIECGNLVLDFPRSTHGCGRGQWAPVPRTPSPLNASLNFTKHVALKHLALIYSYAHLDRIGFVWCTILFCSSTYNVANRNILYRWYLRCESVLIYTHFHS